MKDIGGREFNVGAFCPETNRDPFNSTFNNVLAISWQSALLVEEAGGHGRKPPTCRNSLTNLFTLQFLLLSMNNKIPPISTKRTTTSHLKPSSLNPKIPRHMTLEIQVLALDRHIQVYADLPNTSLDY
jgi:hypothetical protein